MKNQIPTTLAALIISTLTITSVQALPAWLTRGHEYHVATTGSDTNPGSKSRPLKTIMAAAQKAMPGDTITVHAGIYREEVVPPRGGTSDKKRITYQAAPGEKVTITGSETIKGWIRVTNDTWKVSIPNSLFGSFNPYSEKVHGDWFSNNGRTHLTGMVYLNNHWLAEARSLADTLKPAGQSLLWSAAVGPDSTIIHAQFPGLDPNTGNVEISVRPAVINPAMTNIDYLTIRGFDLRNAASNWAAPTSGQRALVSAYWCKGWIIENNEISYSRCCGIALGKYSDKWDSKRGDTNGYYGTIDDALKKGGWSKDKIGSHIVRRNHIHHCGQTGIVGSLGCAFSRIENNEIHDINNQGIWGGAEMAGIKFHGALDVVISGNHIYRCGDHGGLWLDWMAQGTQISNNLFHDNSPCDLFTEVNHGPFLVANNLFLSPAMQSHSWGGSQGGAFVHNLIAGRLCKFGPDGRSTPVMKQHSTEQIALKGNPIGDVRWYNNVFANREKFAAYDNATLPVAAAGNVFTKGAAPSKVDKDALLKPDFDADVKLTQKADGWYFTLASDDAWRTAQKRALVTTELLGRAKIPDQEFTHPDGSPLTIQTDYFGKKRNPSNPFPGPIEITKTGKQEFKVWPK